MNSRVTDVVNFGDWFDQNSIQQNVINNGIWMDNNSKNSSNSESSTVDLTSPADTIEFLFDTEVMARDNNGMCSSVSGFQGMNTVSNDTSPDNELEKEADFRFEESKLSKVSISVESSLFEKNNSLIPLEIPLTDSFAKGEDQIISTNGTNTTRGIVKKKRRTQRKRLTANQKEAHNLIEKRYRININMKIAKLQKIIPWLASVEKVFAVEDCSKGTIQEFSGTLVHRTKLNKSIILDKAIDYILFLQKNERLLELELQKLKKQIEELKSIV